MREFGSFIELQFNNNGEYYKDGNIVKLNTGRAAIYHAICCLGKKTVYLPYYQCESVREFLKFKNCDIKYYHIDDNFEPILKDIDKSSIVVIVNYYGIMKLEKIKKIASNFEYVIIDNSQAFFAKPLKEYLNIYSARKFIGVPDGAYVIGDKANCIKTNYKKDYSSDTSLYLLQRIEYGCEGKAYQSRMINEKRIDNSDIKTMSKLTETILKSIDYEEIKSKRCENFIFMHNCLKDINKLNPIKYIDQDSVPMIYPFVSDNEKLINILLEHKHFQGQWWAYLLDEMKDNCIETWLSKYMIPITIDQRYTREDLKYIIKIIGENV